MSKIVMAVYDTDANGRSEYTEKTLMSLLDTVDFERHSLFISDNASCMKTQVIFEQFNEAFKILYNTTNHLTICHNKENLGTAGAVNLGIKQRVPGEHVVKIDNDVIIHQAGWIDEMEDAIRRDPSIGIIGLKRKDLEERPDHENEHFRSKIYMMPHQPGEQWLAVEQVLHVMGTCQMISSTLLDRIKYFQQPSKYGFDDSLMSLRSTIAGFKNVFLFHVPIDHIDTGASIYSQEKVSQANEVWEEYQITCREYINGTRPIAYDGGFND